MLGRNELGYDTFMRKMIVSNCLPLSIVLMSGLSCSSSIEDNCGDGVVNDEEVCDEGSENLDGWWITRHCNTACNGFSSYCGDGIVDSEELCDSGNANSDGWSMDIHCNESCTAIAPHCGDEVLDPEEICDAGELNSDDYSPSPGGCNLTCSGRRRSCGDGIVDPEEVCDDGQANSDTWSATPHCNGDCSAQRPLCDLVEPSTDVFPISEVPYPVENQHTDEKMILGKVLFWDEQLSSDGSVACGTCHRPGDGGADPRSATARHPGEDGLFGTPDDTHGSPGILGCEVDAAGGITYTADPVFGSDAKVGTRRAPSFLDAMYARSLFWDGRAEEEFIDPDTGLRAVSLGGALESQSLGPLLSTTEMACDGQTFSALHAKLADIEPLAFASQLPNDMANAVCKYPSYPELFAEAFGDEIINTRRIAFAIATYERTLLSNQTPYHRFIAGDSNALTADQQAGLALMDDPQSGGKCARCHIPAQQFGGNRLSNIGFTQNGSDEGAGNGRFRAVPLVNIGLRLGSAEAPRALLHNGLPPNDATDSYASLEAVMDAYNNPPVLGPPTDPQIQALGLSEDQLQDMIDFMVNGLTDPRVASEEYPFDRPRLASEPVSVDR